MRRMRGPVLIPFLLFALACPRLTLAKSWMIGITGIGGAYGEKQTDWNSLISQNSGTYGFHDDFKMFYGAQIEVISTKLAGRFSIGARIERLKENASETGSSSVNTAWSYMLSDTIYLFPVQNGFNAFLRLGIGWLMGSGSYTVGSDSLKFKGQYFTGLASGGLEVFFWHFGLSFEAGYRYAIIPRNTVTAASGTTFAGFNNGDTVMITSGGNSHRFKLDWSGVNYVLSLKFWF